MLHRDYADRFMDRQDSEEELPAVLPAACYCGTLDPAVPSAASCNAVHCPAQAADSAVSAEPVYSASTTVTSDESDSAANAGEKRQHSDVSQQEAVYGNEDSSLDIESHAKRLKTDQPPPPTTEVSN